DNPLEFNREKLIHQFDLLEDIRHEVCSHLRMNLKTVSRCGDLPPSFSLSHIQHTLCAVELWQCTVGAGFIPEKKTVVGEIWSTLTKPQDCLEQAIITMRQAEIAAAKLTGISDNGSFAHASPGYWLTLYDYIPSAFNARSANHPVGTDNETAYV
ncbi:MAG: hypothetical protein ACN4GR_17285, partial [Arenicellales bacterium]